jgi:aryl sulfotransferase
MATSIAGLRPYRTAVFDNRRWAGFRPRPGDIFVCTPPKCGTTWTQTIIASLLWPDGDLPAPVLTISPWIEFELFPIEDVLAGLEAQTHRRFIKTHTPADGIPFFDDARYVVVGRDGRDAFMSLCNHLERFRADAREQLNLRAAADGVPLMPGWDGDVHGFFAQWLADGSHFDHIRTFWDRRPDPRLLFVHYNDLKADLAGETRRIASFLDIPVPDAAWARVVERCTFQAMRARGAEIGPFEVAFEGGANSFLFQGTNGRWRDVLTEDELAAYATTAAARLPPDAAAWLERGRGAQPTPTAAR